MAITRLKADKCPYCQGDVDCVAEAFSDAVPEPGDASICFKCGNVCVFNKQMRLRKPTTMEQRDISKSEEIQTALAGWRSYQIANGRMH